MQSHRSFHSAAFCDDVHSNPPNLVNPRANGPTVARAPNPRWLGRAPDGNWNCGGVGERASARSQT